MIATVAGALLLAFAILALTGRRGAFACYLVLALSWIPARTGFQLHGAECERVMTLASALFSLRNFPHLIMFGMFAILTARQFTKHSPGVLASILLAVVLIGLIIELEEGATSTGHCRMRDLVPDAVGATTGLGLFLLAKAAFRRARLT